MCFDFSHCRTPTFDFEESLLLSLDKARRKRYTLSPVKWLYCLIQIILRAIIPFLIGDETGEGAPEEEVPVYRSLEGEE